MDWLYLGLVALPWWLPLLVLACVLVGGAALGAVIVAVVGAVRTAFAPQDTAEDVDVAEFFADAAR
ncbi:hypothetical protein [Leifsonia sp. NPDC080035]|uniref:Uncharacterized protein n=1 Tax=Leifsonia sp. NPDC080035 TaxID=3143936 RepID=A0AAU7G7Q2_9MICO